MFLVHSKTNESFFVQVAFANERLRKFEEHLNIYADSVKIGRIMFHETVAHCWPPWTRCMEIAVA